jgi:hypothetical protein
LEAVKVGAMTSCLPAGTAAGPPTAYTCAPLPLPLADPYVRGSRISFTPDINCSVSATLAISGFASRPLRRANGDGVLTDDCVAGTTYTAHLDATVGGGWRLQGVPAPTADVALTSTSLVVNDQFCNWMNFPAVQPNGWRLFTTNSTNPTASSQASPTQSPSLCGVTLTSSAVINDEIIFNPYSRQPYVNPTTTANWDMVSWPLILKTSIDNKEVSIGYVNANGGSCYTSGNNCFGFTYRAGTDTNWRFVTISAFTVNNQDTGVAVAADTLYNFRLWATTAGTILGSINGGTTFTVSSNIANVAMYPQIYVKNLTAAAHSIYTPHFHYRATGTGF